MIMGLPFQMRGFKCWIAVTNSNKYSVSLRKVCLEGELSNGLEGHSFFPHGYLGSIRGFPPVLMRRSPAGTTIQHCHLLTILFHYSTDKAQTTKKTRSGNQQFIFKDVLNIHICFKKAKRGSSQTDCIFRGPDFIYSFVTLWEHILQSIHRNSSEGTRSRSPVCQRKKKKEKKKRKKESCHD